MPGGKFEFLSFFYILNVAVFFDHWTTCKYCWVNVAIPGERHYVFLIVFLSLVVLVFYWNKNFIFASSCRRLFYISFLLGLVIGFFSEFLSELFYTMMTEGVLFDFSLFVNMIEISFVESLYRLGWLFCIISSLSLKILFQFNDKNKKTD